MFMCSWYCGISSERAEESRLGVKRTRFLGFGMANAVRVLTNCLVGSSSESSSEDVILSCGGCFHGHHNHVYRRLNESHLATAWRVTGDVHVEMPILQLEMVLSVILVVLAFLHSPGKICCPFLSEQDSKGQWRCSQATRGDIR